MSLLQNILGSPADPIFWPSHGSWERLWHHLRLADKTELQNGSSVGTWSTWREEDDNDASVTCSWSAKSYSMLPFHDLMDYETTWDIESNYWQTYHLAPYYYYTNADLNRMFAPTNPELPFIFDELDWEHCDEHDDKADDDAFGRVSEEGVNDPNSTRISRDPLNNVTKRMGVDDDDDVATPRGANDDVTNDDDADLSHWDGDPTDDSDDDDDDGFTGSGGSGISGGGTTGGGGTTTGGGSSPVSDTDGLDEPARRRAAADADVPGVMRDAFSAGKAAFAPPAANDGLTDHEGFRARLRTNLWSRLGEQASRVLFSHACPAVDGMVPLGSRCKNVSCRCSTTRSAPRRRPSSRQAAATARSTRCASGSTTTRSSTRSSRSTTARGSAPRAARRTAATASRAPRRALPRAGERRTRPRPPSREARPPALAADLGCRPACIIISRPVSGRRGGGHPRCSASGGRRRRESRVAARAAAARRRAGRAWLLPSWEGRRSHEHASRGTTSDVAERPPPASRLFSAHPRLAHHPRCPPFLHNTVTTARTPGHGRTRMGGCALAWHSPFLVLAWSAADSFRRVCACSFF